MTHAYIDDYLIEPLPSSLWNMSWAGTRWMPTIARSPE